MNDTSKQSLLEAALDYAGRGWHVLPLHDAANGSCSCGKVSCGSVGKHPRTAHGLNDATADAATIRRWWTQWPTANVAIATGPASGLVMIGPDGDAGKTDLANLITTFGRLPHAPKEVSGSGGLHLFFRHPGRKISNRKNWKETKIDVRGDGGYSVVAPSVNGAGPYRWTDPPDVVDVPAMPEWLIEWCETDAPKTESTRPKPGHKVRYSEHDSIIFRARKYLATMDVAISGDDGHGKTFAAACTMAHGFALSVDDAYSLLASDYNPRCLPPWSESELRHKIASAKECTTHEKPYGHLRDADRGRNGTRKTETSVPSGDDERARDGPDLFTDIGNGRRFARAFGEDVRYVADRDAWANWDETRWRFDGADVLVEARAKQFARQWSMEAAGKVGKAAQAVAESEDDDAKNEAEKNLNWRKRNSPPPRNCRMPATSGACWRWLVRKATSS